MIRTRLYWNSSIRIFKEGYIIALMCALINMRAFTSDTVGEVGSLALALTIIILAIVVPIILTIKTYKNWHQLNFGKNSRVFGTFYEHMKLKENNDRLVKNPDDRKKFKRHKRVFFLFNSFYYVRRFVLGLTVIYLAHNLLW